MFNLINKFQPQQIGQIISDDLTITIGGRKFKLRKALGNPRHPGISKVGRISFQALADDGSKVKIYSAKNKSQILLRNFIQGQIFKTLYFPDIISSDDYLVAERWIEGNQLANTTSSQKKAAYVKIFNFTDQLHQVELRDSTILQDQFCYIDDYLLPRIKNFESFDFVRNFTKLWNLEFKNYSIKIKLRISHPDLSQNNLILEKNTGKIFVIDNELLGYGKGYVLDKLNTKIIENQKNKFNPDLTDDELCHFWSLRLVGSALENGQLGKAHQIATKIFL
jgi:hypothetical protein